MQTIDFTIGTSPIRLSETKIIHIIIKYFRFTSAKPAIFNECVAVLK